MANDHRDEANSGPTRKVEIIGPDGGDEKNETG
jgi:hypothetical protein